MGGACRLSMISCSKAPLYIVLLSISVILHAHVEPNKSESRRVIKHSLFWFPTDQQFLPDDTQLIEQVMHLTKIPDLIVSFSDTMTICAQIGMSIIRTDKKETLELPSITLNPKVWEQLPPDQKTFILLHEVAHYLLGHLADRQRISYGSQLRYTVGEDIFLNIGPSALALAIYAPLAVIESNVDKVRHRFTKCIGWVTTGLISSALYAVCRQEYVADQQHERDADLLAAKYMSDATAGAAFFEKEAEKSQTGEIVMADYLKLSTHPSHHARATYLKAWRQKL